MGWLDDLESGDLGVQGWSGTDFSGAGEETSVGMFGGAPRGTVLGTLRRVGKKDDAIKTKFFSEGTRASMLRPKKDIKSLEDFRTKWYDPYMETQEEWLKGKGVIPNIVASTQEQKDLGFGDWVLGDTSGELLGSQADYKLAEATWGAAETAWLQAQEDYSTDIADVESAYERDISTIRKQQGLAAQESFQKALEQQTAESQSGFAYSGPIAQAQRFQSDESRSKMEALMTQKEEAKITKEEDLATLEDAMYGAGGAEETYDIAKTTWEGAETDFLTDMQKVGTLSKQAIQDTLTGVGGLQEAALEEQRIEDEYRASSRGTASNLWANLAERNVYKTLDDRLKSMRDVYEGIETSGVAPPITPGI